MEERFAPEDGGKRRGVLSRLRPVDISPDHGLDALLRRLKATSPKADAKLIQKAYEYAAQSHRDQFRASGEQFIEHPLAVANIMSDLWPDTTTIVSSLLHDVVEDTPLTLDDIEGEFGSEVRLIIDGLTKLDKIEFRTSEQHQAENIRKMMLAMAKDIRVLYIKLADRLHNMRTIGHMPRDKQEAKARETLEVFSPLANRLGIHQIRWQLEDLSFATLYPKQFDEIVRMVEERQPERDELLRGVVSELEDALKRTKIKADVSGRPKHYYSIYEKMIVRGKEFGEIFDLVGIRVLVEGVRDCYGALGAIHALWRPIPGRFKDYIAMPKFNMYQSLHTAVLGLGGRPLEIQIRTHAMHATAQTGIAAHWKYKDSKGAGRGEADLAWLQQMLEWQRELSDPREFMESLKIDLYADQVFVFTPKGDVLSFPRLSTPIDFAYAIHTEVGHRCIGGRVNGRLVPLDYQLETGDTVEVLTSKAPTASPSQDWLKLVATPRARSKIRQWFSRERREDAMERGRDELIRALRREGLSIQETLKSDALAGVAKELGHGSVEGLEASIGEGHISAPTVAQRIAHEVVEEEDVLANVPTPVRMRPSSEHGVVVKGLDDVLARLARCCTPVPGDKIIGFVTRGRGVSVHRSDCPNGKALAADAGRLLEVSWDSQRPTTFQVAILVEALDRTKLLRDVATTISDLGVNILSTSSMTNPKTRTAALKFTVELADPAHLEHIIASVKRVDAVFDAYRIVPGRAGSRAGT